MPTPDKPPQRKKAQGLSDEDRDRLTKKLDEIEEAERKAWVELGFDASQFI